MFLFIWNKIIFILFVIFTVFSTISFVRRASCIWRAIHQYIEEYTTLCPIYAMEIDKVLGKYTTGTNHLATAQPCQVYTRRSYYFVLWFLSIIFYVNIYIFMPSSLYKKVVAIWPLTRKIWEQIKNSFCGITVSFLYIFIHPLNWNIFNGCTNWKLWPK